MSTKLDIDSLNTLKAVAELGGVTRAADYLALSQSAVSHKVRRLEQNIDCALLERKAGAPLLTKAGQRLLDYANRIIALHNEALSTLGNKHLVGQIRIGTTEDITSTSLARILGRFTRLYPSINIKAHVEQSLELENKLNAGEIDLAVMQLFADDVQDSDIVYHRDSLIWVCGLDFDLSFHQSLPFIAFDQNCFYRHWAFEQARNNKVHLKTILECPSISGVCNAVEAGLGVSLISQHNMRSSMKRLDGDLPNPPDVAYVVRSRSDKRSKIEQALIDEIIKEVDSA